MFSSKAGGGGGRDLSTQIIGMFHSGFKNKHVFGEKQALTSFFFFFLIEFGAFKSTYF